MMPIARCLRLVHDRPRASNNFMCCKLPCAQRRSRIATSTSEGGPSSHEPSRSGAMRTFQPARRRNAASMKSCDNTWPPKGLRPGSCGSPQDCANALIANDRVVSPIIAVVARPRGNPASDDIAEHAARKLLQAREQTALADERAGQFAAVPDWDRPECVAPGRAKSRRSSSCQRRARSCNRNSRPSASRSLRRCRLCGRCCASVGGIAPA